MDLEKIKSLVDLVTDKGLTEFDLEDGDFHIRIKKGGSEILHAPALLASAPVAVQAPPSAPTDVPPPAAAGVNPIKSPMVGTFYASPSPDSSPYVNVGSRVTPETVVCIIEAMKVMNEIKAECTGIITEMVAIPSHSVEFGSVLFHVRPD